MIFDETKIKNIFENSLYGIIKAVNLYLLAILLPWNKRGATDSQVLTPRKQWKQCLIEPHCPTNTGHFATLTELSPLSKLL